MDERPVHEVRYHGLLAGLTRQVDLEYDYRLNEWEEGFFHQLYRNTWNVLPIYPSGLGRSGILSCWTAMESVPEEDGSWQAVLDNRIRDLSLSYGDHVFRIEADDFFGNRSVAVGTLRLLPLFEFRNNEPHEASAEPTDPQDSTRISLHIKTHFFGETLWFEVQSTGPLSGVPSLATAYNMWDRDLIPLIPQSNHRYTGTLSWKNRIGGRAIMEVRSMLPEGRRLVMRDTLDVFQVTPGQGGSLVSPDGLFRLTWPEEAVYTRLLTTVTQSDWNFRKKQYRISAWDVPFLKRARVEITVTEYPQNESTAGIYVMADEGVRYLNSHWIDGKLTAQTRSCGPFVVLRDTVPPEILTVFPVHNSRIKNRTPQISVSFRDTLSGIFGEENYTILLDQTRVIVEYDPFHDRGMCQVFEPLDDGIHSLDVVIRDRVGNVAEKHTQFFIVR